MSQFDPPTAGLFLPMRKRWENGIWIFVEVTVVLLLLVVAFIFGKQTSTHELGSLLNETRKRAAEDVRKVEETKKSLVDQLRITSDKLVKKCREEVEQVERSSRETRRSLPVSKKPQSQKLQPQVMVTKVTPPTAPAPKPVQRVVTGKTVMVVNQSSKELKVYELELKEDGTEARKELATILPNTMKSISYEGHHGIKLMTTGEGMESSKEDFTGPGPWAWRFDEGGKALKKG